MNNLHEEEFEPIETTEEENLGEDKPDPAAAGQAGDLQGLSNVPEANSESVVELLEEGQSFEASIISGIENAPDADVSEVKTRQVPEDDVPAEYIERDI